MDRKGRNKEEIPGSKRSMYSYILTYSVEIVCVCMCVCVCARARVCVFLWVWVCMRGGGGREREILTDRQADGQMEYTN